MGDDRLRSLHGEYAAFVLRFLSWCCGVRGADVEDVAQLVWLNVHRHGPAPPTPKPWITKIARNVAANERRKASRSREQPSDSGTLDPVGPGLTAEELLSLRAHLAELLEAVPNPDQREALFLAAEGLTAEEIGDVQGVTADCARQRIHMARERLKRADRARVLPLLCVGFEDFIKPLPPDELERQWSNIESAIVHEPPEGDGRSPPSSVPPPLLVPSVPVPPGVLPLLAPKVGPALVGALLGGAAALWLLAPSSATSHELPFSLVRHCPAKRGSERGAVHEAAPGQAAPGGAAAARPPPSRTLAAVVREPAVGFLSRVLTFGPRLYLGQQGAHRAHPPRRIR